MWYRFDNPNEPGVIDVDCCQLAFYDEKGICFDETFFSIDKIGHYITFVETEDEKAEPYDHSKVFIHFNNGDSYELKLEKVERNCDDSCDESDD